MRSGSLLRWALLLLLAAMIVNFWLGQRDASDETGEVWSGRLFALGGILLALAAGLWILEKLGLRVSGARCVDCRKSIPHGHAYCHDHLMSRTMAAREKMHGQRGMGV